MQLLRDNLTLWTSSDSGEAENGETADIKDENTAEPEKEDLLTDSKDDE